MEQFEDQRQKQAVVLARFFALAKEIDALKGKTIAEVFSDEEQVRKLLHDISDEQFIELLNGLNGVIRGIKKDKWGIAQGEMEISGAMESETVFTSLADDKRELFMQIIHAAKKMNQDQRSMEDIALLISVTGNAVHPWEDANGRTSRVIYQLMKDGMPEDPQRMKEMMSEEGRSNLQTDAQVISGDLDSVLRQTHGQNFDNLFSDVITKEFQFDQRVTDKEKKMMIRAFKADGFTHLAIAVNDFLKNQVHTDKYYRDYPGGRRVVMFDALVADLNANDVKELLKKYFEIKKEKIELLIDCMVNPEKPEYRITTKKGEEMTLLDKIKMRINEGL